MSKSRVVIIVRGGVAEVLTQPSEVEVEIRDYDVEGITTKLSQDKEGDSYLSAVWKKTDGTTMILNKGII